MSTHPSPPAATIGVMPASESVRETSSISSQVVGGRTPASANLSVRYQITDLFATLKYTPYSLPSTRPSDCQAAE